MSKQLLVFGDKTFKLTVPDDAKITFGPWSPPNPESRRFSGEDGKRGTLRVYVGSKENIVGVFAGVMGFRDLSLGYAEEIAVEEGARIWKDDAEGYVREEKIKQTKQWIEPALPALAAPKPAAKRKK